MLICSAPRVSFGVYPDSNVHGANMGPTWVLSDQDGSHVGPMNLAIWLYKHQFLKHGWNLSIICQWMFQGDHFKVQTLSYKNGNSNYKSKIVSDLYNGNLCVWQDGLMHTNIHGHGLMIKCCRFEWHHPVNKVYSKIIESWSSFEETIPDSKVHGAIMGPIWGRQDPDRPHVGPMNLAILDVLLYNQQCVCWWPSTDNQLVTNCGFRM